MGKPETLTNVQDSTPSSPNAAAAGITTDFQPSNVSESKVDHNLDQDVRVPQATPARLNLAAAIGDDTQSSDVSEAASPCASPNVGAAASNAVQLSNVAVRRADQALVQNDQNLKMAPLIPRAGVYIPTNLTNLEEAVALQRIKRRFHNGRIFLQCRTDKRRPFKDNDGYFHFKTRPGRKQPDRYVPQWAEVKKRAPRQGNTGNAPNARKRRNATRSVDSEPVAKKSNNQEQEDDGGLP